MLIIYIYIRGSVNATHTLKYNVITTSNCHNNNAFNTLYRVRRLSTYHFDSRYFPATVRRTDDVSIIVFVRGVPLAAGLAPVRLYLRLGHIFYVNGSCSASLPMHYIIFLLRFIIIRPPRLFYIL